MASRNFVFSRAIMVLGIFRYFRNFCSNLCSWIHSWTYLNFFARKPKRNLGQHVCKVCGVTISHAGMQAGTPLNRNQSMCSMLIILSYFKGFCKNTHSGDSIHFLLFSTEWLQHVNQWSNTSTALCADNKFVIHVQTWYMTGWHYYQTIKNFNCQNATRPN